MVCVHTVTQPHPSPQAPGKDCVQPGPQPGNTPGFRHNFPFFPGFDPSEAIVPVGDGLRLACGTGSIQRVLPPDVPRPLWHHIYDIGGGCHMQEIPPTTCSSLVLPARDTHLQCHRYDATVAWGHLEEAPARIIPIPQARGRLSPTGTTASPG